MDKSILKTLKPGEQLVEMQECSLHDREVIEVSVYTKRVLFGYKKYTYPFYFDNKEIAEKFLKYSSYFNVCSKKSSYCSEKNYLYLKLKANGNYYVMIDDHRLNTNHVYFELNKNGIWAGDINDWEQAYLDCNHNKSFMEIFNFANIGLKTNKTYVFKMVEN